MVVVAQKIGTLCVEYRPPETLSLLRDEAGFFSEDECDQFIVEAPFHPRLVPLMPVYRIDARCFSSLKIKCYTIFDALEFAKHLALARFSIKLIPAKSGPLASSCEELEVVAVHQSGSVSGAWAVKIAVTGYDSFIFLSNYLDSAANVNDFKLVYRKD